MILGKIPFNYTIDGIILYLFVIFYLIFICLFFYLILIFFNIYIFLVPLDLFWPYFNFACDLTQEESLNYTKQTKTNKMRWTQKYLQCTKILKIHS